MGNGKVANGGGRRPGRLSYLRDGARWMGHGPAMRKRVIWLGVLLVGAGLITVVVMLSRNAPPRSVTLANGIVLECLGATHGTNHVMPGYSRLAKLLPRPLQSFFGLNRPTQSFTTDTPLLAVWLRDDPAASSNRVGRVGMVSLLADERGVIAGDDTWHSLWPGNRGGGGTFNQQFRALPGRSREITVKFFDEGSGLERPLLGELTFPNPAFNEAPVWEPEPLPAQRTNGGLACRLEQLVAGVGHHTSLGTTATGEYFESSAAESGQRPQALGLFRFEEDGLPSANWVVGTVWLADATGNSIRCGSSSHQCFEDLVAHRFGSILWPDEVWDMTVWAKRKTTASFTDKELIVLENIEVPAMGETNRLDHGVEKLGIEVRVEQFVHQPPAGPGGYSMDDLTHLRVELSELPDDMYFELAELVDEQGRELTGSGWSRTHGKPAVATFAFREIPEGAKTLTARMVLQEGRRFDFRVQPEPVGTNGFRITMER